MFVLITIESTGRDRRDFIVNCQPSAKSPVACDLLLQILGRDGQSRCISQHKVPSLGLNGSQPCLLKAVHQQVALILHGFAQVVIVGREVLVRSIGFIETVRDCMLLAEVEDSMLISNRTESKFLTRKS